MKKLLLPLLCLAGLAGLSQPYGEKLYAHPNTICSSGSDVTVNSKGFVISGFAPSAVTGTPNFYVDKLGPGGVFTPPGAFPFSQSYMVFGDKTCSSAMPQATSLVGANVVEAQVSGAGVWYAVGGAYEQGCFYAGLKNNGNVAFNGFYPFPSGAIRPTKPAIVESNVTQTEYFITGSYNLNNTYFMYILRVKETGALISSMIYTFPNNTSYLQPADIIMSPYTPAGLKEVVVVGRCFDVSGGSGTRGFMMRVDANNLGTVIYYGNYGHPAGSVGRDAFASINVANSPNLGSPGFVIGGLTDISTANGMVWALKVKPTGGILWTSLIKPVTNASAAPIVSILERKSPVYGYTYYGAVTSGNGMMVLKLDDNGKPFVGAGIDNFNEFLYPGPFTSPGVVNDISYLDNGGPNDIGIHVYGTDVAAGGNHYFVEAAFNGFADNGVSGCSGSTILTGAAYIPGPSSVVNPAIIVHPALSQCTAALISSTTLTTSIKLLCNSTTLPAGGSNNRLSGATGIDELQQSAAAFRASPNPVSDKLEIRFTADHDAEIDIRIYDYTGRYIANVPLLKQDGGNVHIAALDMSQLNIESGVYIINANINGVKASQRIVYTKGQ